MPTPSRTILVTGANTGIGAAAAEALAAPGVRLVLACRSRAKTEPVLARLRAKGAEASFLELDLADLAAADAAGRAFARAHDTLDVLVNNAGLAGQRGLTKDGFELAFGVNHLGHVAFTRPLLPLLDAARGRVVVVSSGNHKKAKSIPWSALRRPTASTTGLAEYGVSKLANVLFAAELRRRHPSLGVVSLNPGRIASDIWRSVPGFARPLVVAALCMRPVAFGGDTIVHAVDVPLGEGAPLYFDKKVATPENPLALDTALAARMWDYSERAVDAAVAAKTKPASHQASL